jgi:hypothetical protein
MWNAARENLVPRAEQNSQQQQETTQPRQYYQPTTLSLAMFSRLVIVPNVLEDAMLMS